MKKFLSMFLVLTMVVTALMGVMITDVSAVTVVKKSDGVYEITMGEKANSSMGGIGTYKVKGNDDPDFMPLAEVSKVSLLGKEYIYYDFEAVTVNDSSKVSSNYLRFPTNVKPSTTTYEANSYVNSIPRETFLNDIKDGKYYKLTFYGYSKTGVGESMNLGVNRETSAALTVSLSPAKIKSDAEVPHKIDVIAYGDSDGTYAYETVYIDGVLAGGGHSYATSGYNQKKSDNVTYQYPNVKFNNYIPSVGFSTTKVSYTGKAMDYVIENYGVRDSKVDVQVLTKEELDKELFVVITPNTDNSSTQTSTARTDDVITGVQDDVDKAIVTAVTNTSAGDRVAEIPAKYTTVGSIYTDKANSNVTAVDKVTGEVAEDTAVLSDVLLMVNGVYITVTEKPEWVEDPTKYTADGNKPFNITEAQDGKVTTRIRMNDYTSTPAPDSLGGIDTGFYKYTSEPRGSFTFDKGTVKYGDNGYYGLNTLKSAATSFQTSRYVTLEFDMYISGYDINDGGTYLALALGKDKDTRANMDSVYFVTKESDKTKTPLGSGLVLMPNAWNRVKIEFDFTQAEDGIVTARAYANGASEPEQTVKTSSDATSVANVKNMYSSSIQRIDFARLYPTKYTSVGIMNDRWYLGRTENTGLNVSTSDIDVTGIDNITVDNSTNMLIWQGTDEGSLVSAMEAKGYTPVYNYTYASSAEMNAAYDEIDGTRPEDEDDVSNQFTYSGNLINKWIEATGSYDSSVENGVSATSLCASAKNILSITKTGENYTMVVNSSFGDITVFPGICTSMDDILAAKPNLRTKTLSGFAVTDSGMMPRVYTIASGTTKLSGITVSETGLATLFFDRFDDSTLDAYMLVGAYDVNGKLIDLKIKDVSEEYSAATGLEKTITLQSGASENVRLYQAFLIDNHENVTPLIDRAYKLITQ